MMRVALLQSDAMAPSCSTVTGESSDANMEGAYLLNR